MAYYSSIEILSGLVVVCMVLVFPLIESTQACHWMKATGHGGNHCPFRVRCDGTINNIIREDCQGSSNDPFNIELILDKANEKLSHHLSDDDINFLRDSVSLFKMNTEHQYPNLDILDYMNRLNQLDLSHNGIMQINGTPFYHLYSLETLYMSHNRLNNVDELFEFELHPNNLKVLSLAHNHIQELAGSAFEELSSLKELDLSYNYIRDLKEEPFMNLTSLEILRINHNKIKDLNGAVNNLMNLKHFFLQHNEIGNINTESLKIIYELETFDISGNQLDDLGPIMFTRHWEHFNDICRINLSNNQITVLPNATLGYTSSRYTRQLRKYGVDVSTELDLSNNTISDIKYNAFHSIIRLTSLDLSQNKIIVFDVNTTDLIYLKYLNLNTNFITLFYVKSFSSLSNLQNLDLSFNSLEKIPQHTFENHNYLKYVNMTHNYISNFQTLRIKMFHPDGGVLDLSNNGLSELNIPEGQGLRLTNLILHSNNIIDASRIKLNNRQSELKFLDLSNNHIKGLKSKSLLLPNSLVFLDLRFNNISFVEPGAFNQVNKLITLRLSHNHIKSLEFGIFEGLMYLQNLDLSFNNITLIDSKVFLDLKFLTVLSLRYNEIYYMDYKVWLGHKSDLKVYIEGNNITCQWLGTALNDYYNGVSKMRPEALQFDSSQNSLGGIPCIKPEVGQLIDASSNSLSDEKLLITTQKILEAIKEQTSYLRTIINHISYNPKTFPVQSIGDNKK